MTSSIAALLLSLATLLSGLTAQLNALQIQPTTQTAQVVSSQASTLTPSSFTLDGYWDLSLNYSDTAYMHGLTLRHVNGQVELLTMTHTGTLMGFYLGSTALGGKINPPPAETWAMPRMSDYTSIWFNEATQRLFITGSGDYVNITAPAWVVTATLGPNGSVTNVHTITLSNVNEKRMYGGCRAIPTNWQATMGGAYACGYGGYTSLVDQGGGASLGPALFVIPDPDSLANNASVNARILLNVANMNTNRGVRATSPINYFDGGGVGGPPNGQTAAKPTYPPNPTAGQWLSPNAQGLGWWTWGDDNDAAEFIGDTFVLFPSVGEGAVWYCNSSLCYERRSQEIHTWNASKLTGANPLQQPDALAELVLPIASIPVPPNYISGNAGLYAHDISGSAFDSATNKEYLVMYDGGTGNQGRLYRLSVNTGTAPAPTPSPTPTPTPVNATVSAWSAWADTSAWGTCTNGTQTKTQVQTRTVTSPALNGGTTPALSQTQTISQSCTVVSTPITPPVINTNKFLVGDSVQTTSNLNIRETPNGGLAGTQALGAIGTISSGPTNAGGTNWWMVNFTSAPSGWSAESYLTKTVTTTPSPTPTPSDAVVSAWGAWIDISNWSSCSTSGTQTKTQQRSRTIVTSATNGGVTPSLVETQTVSQSCTTVVTPVDAIVSSWSAWVDTSSWTACDGGKQAKTQQRTRTVITPATNGGSTPSLSETQTVSQDCSTTPVPVPVTPTPEPTPAPITQLLTKDLYYGSSGSQVTILQNSLIQKGYLSEGNAVGYFGRLTYNAVKAFQRANNIRTTGYVGPQTRAVINAGL